MEQKDMGVGIMKTLWGREKDGRWGITDIKGIDLKPQAGADPKFFRYESQMELLTNRPLRGRVGGTIHDLLASFGTTNSLLKQSILPVVAWAKDERAIRCIGTASVISCSGYLMTACHVLLDPVERDYGEVKRTGSSLIFGPDLNMGVLIPHHIGYSARGTRFFPFEQCWYWGEWKESPLIHESDRFQYLTDIAICKIAEIPEGVAHQPLNLSLNAFKPGETAYAIGYALMEDIPIENKDGVESVPEFTQDIYVSVGNVMNIFPENHLRRDVPAPGPCFDFNAKIPGKMSGGPILGAQGSVIRGVVSRSFSGESHAFGSMLGPTMYLSLGESRTLKSLMQAGTEGIAQVQGPGL